MKFTKSKSKGFTLVELLVVMAIIGILATIALPKFLSITDGAKKSAALANHRMLQSMVLMYQSDNAGAMPADYDALVTAGYFDTIQNKPEGATYTVSSIGEVSTSLLLGDGTTTQTITGQDYVWTP